MKWRAAAAVAGIAGVAIAAALWVGRPGPITVDTAAVARGKVRMASLDDEWYRQRYVGAGRPYRY